MLLVITLPARNGAHSAYSLAGMISFEAGMLVIGALLVSGPQLGAPDHHHGIMLGAAAGMLFGVSDVAIKALTGVGGFGEHALLAVAGDRDVASVVAFYVSARGMQQGDAVPVIAATSTAANVSCILGGIVVFGDPMPGRHARHRPPGRRLRDGHPRRPGHPAPVARRGQREPRSRPARSVARRTSTCVVTCAAAG